MTRDEVRHLQTELNKFTNTHRDLGFVRLIIDGDYGAHTKTRLHDVKYMLGYMGENLKEAPNENFFKRLHHPDRVEPAWGVTAETVKRGKQRRAHRHRWVIRNKVRAYLKPGVGTFDGIPVAKCAIPILEWCRQHGWGGRLVSGYRSPAYSEQLCYRMCGRASCPGRCAGRATNHAYAIPSRFSIDVSDYARFGHIVAKCPIAPHIHNALPIDLVHFSPSGR